MVKFKVGDKVRLSGCPFNEQIPEEAMKFAEVSNLVQTVCNVKRPIGEIGTSGQWIKTDVMLAWTDAAWFEYVVS